MVGMPTANMEVLDESILPPAGVYVTEILLDGRMYYGITNIGTRPTGKTTGANYRVGSC